MSDEPIPFAAVPGVRLAAVAAGIRYQNRKDLCLLELAPGAQCAAVFTRNAFCAAPVILARRHLAADVGRHFDLFVVLLAGVRVREIDHDALRQAGFGQFMRGRFNV